MEPRFSSDNGREKDGEIPENYSERKAQQKRLFSVVFFVGVSALLIGGFSLYDRLHTPFPKSSANANTAETDDVANAVSVLRGRDTDSDGLTDYDELYAYHTSPFLKDSDSDGVGDGAEISGNTDPNCPTGKSCGAVAANTNGDANTNAAAITEVSTLRQALIKSGAPASVINGLDDATIISQYQDAVTGTNGNAAANSDLASADLENLNATQLRSLLEANGIDAATLDTIDDGTLMTLYSSALSNTNS